MKVATVVVDTIDIVDRRRSLCSGMVSLVAATCTVWSGPVRSGCQC